LAAFEEQTIAANRTPANRAFDFSLILKGQNFSVGRSAILPPSWKERPEI